MFIPKSTPILEKIRNRYSLLKCEPFLAQHLEATLFGLAPDIIEGILNSNRIGRALTQDIISKEKYYTNTQLSFTFNNHIDMLVFELVQKNQNRVATPSDLYVYVPIIEKYGMERGIILVERSLKASRRASH